LPERVGENSERVVGGCPSPVGFGGVEQEVVERGGAFGFALFEADAGLAQPGAALVYEKPLSQLQLRPKLA
jgi:hypothetical protein